MLRSDFLMRLALISLKSILLFGHYAAQWVSCAPCICLLKIDFLVLAKISLNSQLSTLNFFSYLCSYETIYCTFEDLGAEATQVYLARIFGVARRVIHAVVYLEAELHLHHRLQYQG